MAQDNFQAAKKDSVPPKKWHYIPSISLGYSSSFLANTGEENVDYNFPTNSIFHFAVGIMLEYQFNKKLGLEYGFQFERYGDKSTVMEAEEFGYFYLEERYYKMKTIFLTIPFSLKLHLTDQFTVRTGILNSFSAGQRHHLTFTETGKEYLVDGEDRFYNLGTQIGFGYAFDFENVKLGFGPLFRSYFTSTGQLNDENLDSLPARHLYSLSMDLRLVF